MFVPCIPPKKPIGNMDKNFIEERRHFLDKFLKELVKIPYLADSIEFKLFLRSPLEYEKVDETLSQDHNFIFVLGD